MEQESLISKKMLLEKYGISYGALYRWKRKGLIPDRWFIKKTTVTGQETFFPDRLICERVETILSMKEDVLLDDLAKNLSGEEKKDEFLYLSTEFGEKSFKISEIKGIFLLGKDGIKSDITEKIKEFLDEMKGDQI